MFILSASDEHARLKSYDAAVKGSKAVLRITIEVSDTFTLSYLLRSLGDVQKEQAAAAKRKPAEAPAKAKALPQIERQNFLALPPPSRNSNGGV